MQEAARQAVEVYRRQQLLAAANAAYAKVRADPKASRSFDDEIAAWDIALADGLNDSTLRHSV